MIRLFFYDIEKDNDIEYEEFELEEALDEFFNLSDLKGSFLGLIDKDDNIMQFSPELENEWFIDIPQENGYSYQVYLGYEQCLNVIKNVYLLDSVTIIKSMIKVNTKEETLEEVLKRNSINKKVIEKQVILEIEDVRKQKYKVYKGKNYTKEEWSKFEQREFENYLKKNNIKLKNIE